MHSLLQKINNKKADAILNPLYDAAFNHLLDRLLFQRQELVSAGVLDEIVEQLRTLAHEEYPLEQNPRYLLLQHIANYHGSNRDPHGCRAVWPLLARWFLECSQTEHPLVRSWSIVYAYRCNKNAGKRHLKQLPTLFEQTEKSVRDLALLPQSEVLWHLHESHARFERMQKRMDDALHSWGRSTQYAMAFYGLLRQAETTNAHRTAVAMRIASQCAEFPKLFPESDEEEWNFPSDFIGEIRTIHGRAVFVPPP